MTPKDFLESKGIFGLDTKKRTNEVYQWMKEYAEHKVKNCNTPAVSVNEVAVCGLGVNPYCRFKNKRLECTSIEDCKHKQTDR